MDKSRKKCSGIMDKKGPSFELVVERLKKEFVYNSDRAFAKAIGMTPTAFNNRKKNESLPYPEIIDFLNKRNVNLNWAFTGDIPVYNKEQMPYLREALPKSTLKIIIEHQNLIAEFDDPEEGLDTNKKLIDLQKTNKSLYKSALQSLTSIWNAAMELKNAQRGNYSAPDSDINQKEERRKEPRPERLKGQKNEKNGTNDQ